MNRLIAYLQAAGCGLVAFFIATMAFEGTIYGPTARLAIALVASAVVRHAVLHLDVATD